MNSTIIKTVKYAVFAALIIGFSLGYKATNVAAFSVDTSGDGSTTVTPAITTGGQNDNGATANINSQTETTGSINMGGTTDSGVTSNPFTVGGTSDNGTTANVNSSNTSFVPSIGGSNDNGTTANVDSSNTSFNPSMDGQNDNGTTAVSTNDTTIGGGNDNGTTSVTPTDTTANSGTTGGSVGGYSAGGGGTHRTSVSGGEYYGMGGLGNANYNFVVSPLSITHLSGNTYLATFSTTPEASAFVAYGHSSVATYDATSAYYGYQSGSAYDAATGTHKITLTLAPGTTYFLRTVARYNGVNFGNEITFKTLGTAVTGSNSSEVVGLNPSDVNLATANLANASTTDSDLNPNVANAGSAVDGSFVSWLKGIWNYIFASLCDAVGIDA